MRARPLLALLTAAVTVTGLLALAASAGAASRVSWLCRPGASPDPCRASLTATVLGPRGKRLGIERTRLARRPAVDCFYVYPTVSGQPGPVAARRREAAVRAIAHYQASRFSSVCRVWAPLYRQITLAGLASPASVTPAMREAAYRDVRDAWRAYLRRGNRGRGVVLIGHSQGTFVLRRLVAEEIDRRPAVRRRLVSALLLGGNVTVRRGRDRGGDFARIPACRRAGQTGCVVAYSAFGAVPPANALFGRGAPAGQEVLCTNPAALGGGSGTLRAYTATAPFPGLLGLGIAIMLGKLPAVPTPWLSFRGAYRARCSGAGGAHVLRVTAARGARRLTASPDATWGLHLGDVNLALGNLTALVTRQTAAYVRAHR